MSYLNRQEAGKQLTKALSQYKGEDVVVLALPRGGVVLGAEVAKGFRVPLGLILVRKIGHPSYAEYAIGAIAEDGAPVYNEQEITTIDTAWLRQAEAVARELIEQRRKMYYGRDFVAPDITDKTVILVDDGIATGLTMKAAVQSLQHKHPKQVVVAVPVASLESINLLKNMVDRVIVLDNPKYFLNAVGAHYKEFNQVNDEEVRALLREVSHDTQNSVTAYR